MSDRDEHANTLESFESAARRLDAAIVLLLHESDRGCALVGGAMIDDALAVLLRAFFIHDPAVTQSLMTSPNAPLATLSSRIDLVRALGLVSDVVHRDLTVVRRVRNVAAHFDHRGIRSTEFTFADADISDRCRAIASLPPAFKKLPPRAGFVSFVSMASTIFAEHAANASIARDRGDRLLAVNMLLQVSPVVPFEKHLDRLVAAFGHADVTGESTEAS